MQLTAQLQSNLNKMNWHSFCFGFMPYVPIVFLFYKSVGLTFAEIGMVSSAMWLAQLTLGIPAGIFADKYGRKTAIAIAALLSALGLVLTYFGSSFEVFFLANLIAGASHSFIAGSDTSYIHDSLEQEGKESFFSRHLGKYYGYFFGGAAISSALASFLPEDNYRLGFAISVPFAILSFLVVSSATEPKTNHASEQSKLWAHFSEAIGWVVRTSGLLPILLYYVILTAAIQIFFRYMQFIMADAGIDPKFNGLLYALFIGIAASSSYWAHGIEQIFKRKGSLLILLLAIVLPLLVFGLTNILIFVLVAILFVEIAYGLLRPVMSGYFHKLVKSHNRATVDSIKAFSVDGTLVVLLPIFGYLADHFGIAQTMLYLALFTVLISALPLLKLVQHSNKA